MHARNLAEFAERRATPKKLRKQQTTWFALAAIPNAGQPRTIPNDLRTFLNTWVVHLGESRGDGSTWPKDLTGNVINEHANLGNEDFDRLSKIAELVFKLIEPDDRTKLTSDEGVAYVEVVKRVREYFTQRTAEAFDNMTCWGVPMPDSQ